MKTATAISAMMTNVLSVAKIPPMVMKTTHMARIAPRIVKMMAAGGDPGRPRRVGAEHRRRVCQHPGDPPWRAVELEADPAGKHRSAPAGWPLRRGMFVQLSPYGGVLWLTGTAPTLSVRGRE